MLNPALPASVVSLPFARPRRSSFAQLLRAAAWGDPGTLPGDNCVSVCDVCFRRLPGSFLSPRFYQAEVVGTKREGGGLAAHLSLGPAISSHGPGPSAAVTELPRAVTALPAPERTAGQSALPEPARVGGRACSGTAAPAAVTGQVMGQRRRCETGEGTQVRPHYRRRVAESRTSRAAASST